MTILYIAIVIAAAVWFAFTLINVWATLALTHTVRERYIRFNPTRPTPTLALVDTRSLVRYAFGVVVPLVHIYMYFTLLLDYDNIIIELVKELERVTR